MGWKGNNRKTRSKTEVRGSESGEWHELFELVRALA